MNAQNQSKFYEFLAHSNIFKQHDTYPLFFNFVLYDNLYKITENLQFGRESLKLLLKVFIFLYKFQSFLQKWN